MTVGATGLFIASFFLNLGLTRYELIGTKAACQMLGHISKVIVFSRSWSTKARHTVRLVVLGTSGHPRVDASRVGLFGHSSGGWVVPIVALRSPPVAFLVLHSGPAEPLGDQQGHVFQELVRRSGIDPTDEELAEVLEFFRTLVARCAAGAR